MALIEEEVYRLVSNPVY